MYRVQLLAGLVFALASIQPSQAFAANDDESIPGGTREDIILVAADAMSDAYTLSSDGSFEIHNYTDEDIKTCFYYPKDKIMRIPIAIEDDKDDCITTPAVGKKAYRTDTVRWSQFKRKPGYYHTLERELNARVFKKGLLDRYVKTYCQKKGLFQPDVLEVRKDGSDCRLVSTRKADVEFLRDQGITLGKDVLRWSDAHSEDLSYLVARNDRFVIVAVRGTSNYANEVMNGERAGKNSEKPPKNAADRRKSRANAVPIPKRGASVHTGWWRASGKIFEQVEPSVRDWAGKSGSKRQIIITGHSMGGAVTMYLATRFMEEGYRGLHVVTFGGPRVTTKSFVAKFNRLAESNAESVSIVERPDDPRIEDWTSQIEDLPTINIVPVSRYRGQLVMYRSGCSDPHSAKLYRGRARSSAFVCDETPVETGRRRRAGRPEGGAAAPDREPGESSPDRRNRREPRPPR